MIQTNLPLALRQQHIGDRYPGAINLHNLCLFNKTANKEKRDRPVYTQVLFVKLITCFVITLQVSSKFAVKYISSVPGINFHLDLSQINKTP